MIPLFKLRSYSDHSYERYFLVISIFRTYRLYLCRLSFGDPWILTVYRAIATYVCGLGRVIVNETLIVLCRPSCDCTSNDVARAR